MQNISSINPQINKLLTDVILNPNSPEWKVRKALEEMTRIPSQEALDALKAIVNQAGLPDETTILAINHLRGHLNRPDVVGDLAAIAYDTNRSLDVRCEAVRALGSSMGSKEAIQVVAAVTEDPNIPRELRDAALLSLQHRYYPHVNPALPASDRESHLRALQGTNNQETFRLILEDATATTEERQAAIEGLSQGPRESAELLETVVRDPEADPKERAVALAALANNLALRNVADTSKITDLAQEILGNQSSGIDQKSVALRLLGTVDHQETQTIAERTFDDHSTQPQLRAAALSLISSDYASSPSTIQQYREIIADSSADLTLLVATLNQVGALDLKELTDEIHTRYQQEDNGRIKNRLLDTLADLGDKRYIPALQQSINSAVVFLNHKHVQGLINMDPDSASKAIQEKISSSSTSEEVREQLIPYLKNFPAEIVQSTLLQARETVPESRSVERALAALGDSSATASVVEKVRTIVNSTSDLGLSSSSGHLDELSRLVSTLADSSDPQVLETLVEMMNNTSNQDLNYFIRRELPADPKALGTLINNLRNTQKPELIDYAHNLDQALDLGIDHPLRYSPQSLAGIVKNRATLDTDKSTTVLLVAKSDHNGYLNGVANLVDEAAAAGVQLVVYEVGSEQELKEALLEAQELNNGPVDNIIFAAHGSRNSIQLGDPPQSGSMVGAAGQAGFGDERYALDSNDYDLFKDVSSVLTEGGNIVIAACSAGDGANRPEVEQNLTRFLREGFPQAREQGIFGSVSPTLFPEITFNHEGKIERVDYSYDTFQANIPEELEQFIV